MRTTLLLQALLAIVIAEAYIEVEMNFRGGVKFPTGGNAAEALAPD